MLRHRVAIVCVAQAKRTVTCRWCYRNGQEIAARIIEESLENGKFVSNSESRDVVNIRVTESESRSSHSSPSPPCCHITTHRDDDSQLLHHNEQLQASFRTMWDHEIGERRPNVIQVLGPRSVSLSFF
jgi:hypothetical protein